MESENAVCWWTSVLHGDPHLQRSVACQQSMIPHTSEHGESMFEEDRSWQNDQQRTPHSSALPQCLWMIILVAALDKPWSQRFHAACLTSDFLHHSHHVAVCPSNQSSNSNLPPRAHNNHECHVVIVDWVWLQHPPKCARGHSLWQTPRFDSNGV